MPLINSAFTAIIRNPSRRTLLEYLTQRFTYHDQEKWLELLQLGRLTLEEKIAAGNELLREGQKLRFEVVDYNEPFVPLDFKVITNAPNLKLIHKPAGMPVHRTGKIFFQTMANLVREHLNDNCWSPLNRLDVETSGLMAFAKGPESLKEFAPASESTQWIKLYAAIVVGAATEAKGIIDFSLAEKENAAIRCQMFPVTGETGKKAVTLYQVIENNATHSLLVLAPITGRKHQIRAHLAAIGLPIVGDKIYSQSGWAYLKQLDQDLSDGDYKLLGAKTHLLHAFYLRLENTEIGSIEGWDFAWAEEFNAYFNSAILQKWCLQDSVIHPELQKLINEAKQFKLKSPALEKPDLKSV